MTSLAREFDIDAIVAELREHKRGLLSERVGDFVQVSRPDRSDGASKGRPRELSRGEILLSRSPL